MRATAVTQEGFEVKQKPVILIVEDDQAMRQFLRRALEADYATLETPSARRALELALHHEPDCILLDLVLPGFSGLEFCQICSTLRFTRGIPIVILTGQPAEQYREICLGLGATEYFEKAIDPSQLIAYLAQLLKYRPRERRAEDRAQLSLFLRLRGTDAGGMPFEAVATTDDVNRAGFVCGCAAALEDDAIVEVFFHGPVELRVGRARVARRERADRYLRKYAFRFLEEPRIWLPAEAGTELAPAAGPARSCDPDRWHHGTLGDDNDTRGSNRQND